MSGLLTFLLIVLYIVAPGDIFPILPTLKLTPVLTWLAFAYLAFRSDEHARLLTHKQTALLLIFYLLLPLSLLVHLSPRAALLSLFEFLPNLILYALILATAHTLRSLQYIIFLIILLQLLLASIGILQYSGQTADSPWILNQLSGLDEYDDNTYIRRLQALGTLNDPNAFAQFLVSALPLWWSFSITKHKLLFQTLRLACIFVILYATYLTRSRGAYIGLIALVLLLIRSKYGNSAAAFLLVACVVILLPVGIAGRRISLEDGGDRLAIWSDGLGMFFASPMIGVGYRQFSELSAYTAHNSFLLVLTELGLVGGFVWCALFVLSHKQINYALLNDSKFFTGDQYRQLLLSVQFSLYLYLVMGFFLSRTYHVLLYILLALVVSAISLVRDTANKLPLEFYKIPFTSATISIVVAIVGFIYVIVRAR